MNERYFVSYEKKKEKRERIMADKGVWRWNEENKPGRGCIVDAWSKSRGTRAIVSSLHVAKVRSAGDRRPFARAACEQPDNDALTL